MYDSNKVYRYENKGHEFHVKPVTQLHRFNGTKSGMPWRGVVGGEILGFSDNDPQLVEVDPVTGYRNVYGSEVSWHFDTLAGAIADEIKGVATGRFAIHASGKVRNIPLDARTDPEAGQ